MPRRLLLAAALLLPLMAGAQEADHPAGKPLVVGSDFGVAPWMVRGAGGPEGFGVDLMTEIAKRLGRPGVEIVDVNFSGLFAALFAKRFEFTANPLNITEERAQRMLYTEPFFATGNGFITRRSDSLAKLEDLKGKMIAVNRGTISDTWATANAEKYGFEVQRYDTFPDSVQAVLTRRAFAAINEIPTTVYAASQNRQITVAFKDYTGRNFGIAFRPESRDYRNKVDRVIECLKQDGTLAKLHEKWYGSPPDAGSSMTQIYAGYGPPGLPGFEEDSHKLGCE
ncbi:ABC transporter substrate-binding protein [Paracraurococcus lichenis]|uniref:ABC transporter substrate-binding protein n=1 Tax=Paracraurococcus lichenis TaxID=3064888 RepID=A0ABT9DU70_9PROT|nr:ABC transporter substrate-binding protein [Paracraurococcus sp. LOR1-02]MDO9707446.1 ABC transporter substrate-binding protein [Paracraurococcus sp. LOR1-02]